MRLFERIVRKMQQNEIFRITGQVHWVLRDETGKVKQVVDCHNLITTAGKAWLADYLAPTPPAIADYLAIGTNTTAASIVDTALGAEQGTRVQATLTNSGAVWQLVGTFAAANPATAQAITEAGILNASSVGTLFARQVFAAINKATTDSLQCTWQITFS
jgi:hypothetical protein